jgi:RNA polymerase sigma factor (sigma-70 family)
MNVKFTDDQVISIIKTDLKALNQGIQYLYAAHYPSVKNFILSNGGNEANAADLFQEALVILYVKIRKDEFNASTTIADYLSSVARNLWLKQMGGQSHQVNTEFNSNDSFPLEDLLIHESQSELRQALNRMDTGDKDLLIDFYYGRLSIEKLTQKFHFENHKATKIKVYENIQKLLRLIQENKNRGQK